MFPFLYLFCMCYSLHMTAEAIDNGMHTHMTPMACMCTPKALKN